MPTTFPIRLSTWMRPLLLVIGVFPSSAWIRLSDEFIEIRYGVLHKRIPLHMIHRVEPTTWPWYLGLGLRIGPRSTLGLIGSLKGVITIQFRQAQRMYVPWPMWVERLAISLEDAEKVEMELNQAISALSGE